MAKFIPNNLICLLKNGCSKVEDCCEFSSELHRILSQEECQQALNNREIEVLREFANKINREDDIGYYTKDKIKRIELELFGTRGALGFLRFKKRANPETAWSF